jgi:hypothetical protein
VDIDVNAIMGPLILVLTIGALIDIALSLVRRVMSGAVDGERDADD